MSTDPGDAWVITTGEVACLGKHAGGGVDGINPINAWGDVMREILVPVPNASGAVVVGIERTASISFDDGSL